MRHEKQIREAAQLIELSLPRLKETVGAVEMPSVYGILDALKWVLQEPSHIDTLLRGCREEQTDKTYYR